MLCYRYACSCGVLIQSCKHGARETGFSFISRCVPIYLYPQVLILSPGQRQSSWTQSWDEEVCHWHDWSCRKRMCALPEHQNFHSLSLELIISESSWGRSVATNCIEHWNSGINCQSIDFFYHLHISYVFYECNLNMHMISGLTQWILHTFHPMRWKDW